MDKEKKKRLDAAMATINKRFGKGTVSTAAQMQKNGRLTKRIIRTASIELNDALWCGGFCGIVELFGPNSSGKTSLAIETIAAEQKRDPDFVAGWLETEGSVTDEMFTMHGVDMDRLIFWKQEDVGNAENALDVARGIIASGEVGMLVVNSVAGLSPSVEIESDLDKQNIALVARIMSKFFRVANGLISKNDMVVVFINQTRDNVGQLYGDPAIATGGRALGYYASQRIRMSKPKLDSSDPIKIGEGVKISCMTKKNRFSLGHDFETKCVYYATFAHGIDPIAPLPQMLKDKGIMTVKGSWWYYYDANGNVITIDGIDGKFGSKGMFIDTLRNNESWKNAMLNIIRSDGPAMQTDEEKKDIDASNQSFNSLMADIDAEEAAAETGDPNLDGMPI